MKNPITTVKKALAKKPVKTKTPVGVKTSKSKKAKVATTKKVTAKKTKSTRPLIMAPDPKSFWTSDGQILNNLKALAESFARMDTLLYKYHVNSEQNDFADWVEAVLEDSDCASALRRAKTPKSAHTVIIRHLQHYSL